MSKTTSDRTPLLENGVAHSEEGIASDDATTATYIGAASLSSESQQQQQEARKRSVVSVVLTFLFIAAIVVSFTVWNESISRDPHKAALSILNKAPVIVSSDL
jgi:hypothetical protein